MPPAGRRAVGLVYLDVLRVRYPEAEWTLEPSKGNAATTSGEINGSLAVEENDGPILDRLPSAEEDDRVEAGGEQSPALPDSEFRPEAA